MSWSRSHPRARKEHTCTLCLRTIRVGEVYLRGAGFGEGRAWTWRECLGCEQFIAFVSYAGGLDECGAVDLEEFEPETVGQLRVKTLWRRRWQRADGSLYPVPELVRGAPRGGTDHTYTFPVDIRMPEEAAHAA